MQRGISVYRLVKALRFALLVEEAVLVALGDEEVELEVATGELHTAGDGGPFAEDDGLVLGGAVGEGVAADDVLFQHVSQAFFITDCTTLVANLANHFGKKPFTTSLSVVGQDVNAIAGADGDEALELPVGRGFDILQKGEFATEDFDEEVAVAAGGLEESAVEPEGLVAHKVEHGVHLAGIGEHFAVVSHPLAAFDLFCVFVAWHKKIVELFLRLLRCSTTCQASK